MRRGTAQRPVLLIVDDEERILSALRRSLRREGFEIVTAGSGREALARLREGPVRVILSDYKMPGMSGLELLDEARRLQPGATRLLITGWNEEVARERARSLGVQAVIPKPWDDRSLKAILGRYR